MTPTRITTWLALATTLAMTIGCDRSGAVDRPSAEAKPAVRAPLVRPLPTVEVIAPELATVRRISERPGRVEAAGLAPLHATIAGVVRKLCVNLGDSVRKGQLLVELDAPEVTAEVAQRRAQLDRAGADHARAEAAVEAAKAVVALADARRDEAEAAETLAVSESDRRNVEAGRYGSATAGVPEEIRTRQRVAQNDCDAARARLRVAVAAETEAETALENARAAVVAASAGMAVARANLARAEAVDECRRIVAPFDGHITHRDTEVGRSVGAGVDGPPLFVVTRSDFVRVAFDVPETSAPWVDPGDSARIMIPALGNRVVDGTVSRTSWALDPESRTLAVQIDLPIKSSLFRPGYSARVTLIEEERNDAMTVPPSALIREGEKAYLALVVDGRIVRREVMVGIAEPDRVEIAVGLDGGESIAKSGAHDLLDGQAVTITPTPSASLRQIGTTP